MRKLFKYFSDLDTGYFSNPSFKLASASTLNDPFETILAKELLDTLELFTDKDSPSYKMFKRLFGENAELKESYDTLFKMCGVVSLSETQHNLLMWAHYANQHTGFCVGYRSDVLSEMEFPKYVKLPLHQNPVKVNYDSKKTFDYVYDFNYDSDNELFKSVLNKVLTTKGDDWIYEKEHRFILPVSVADRCRVYRGGKLEREEEFYKSKENRYLKKNRIRPFTINDAANKNNSYLLDIDPSYITEVYLGCKMDLKKAKRIKIELERNQATKHIEVYRFTESKDRFELEIDKSF
ncbi:DUF2971 domain-containing protein [Aeromonas veronii]